MHDYTLYAKCIGIIAICLGIPIFCWYVILPLISGSSDFTAYNLLLGLLATIIVISIGLPLCSEIILENDLIEIILSSTTAICCIVTCYKVFENGANFISKTTHNTYPDPFIPSAISIILIMILLPIANAYARCKNEKESEGVKE